MKKQPCQLYFEEDIAARLDSTASRYGMTKNTLLAAVGYELSRIPADQLWHRLSRLTAEEGPARRSQASAPIQTLDAIEVPGAR